jgi:hypothetical protein
MNLRKAVSKANSTAVNSVFVKNSFTPQHPQKFQ